MVVRQLKISKKKIIILCSILTFLSVSWFALFNYAAQNLTLKIEQIIMDLNHKGYVLSYKKISLSGNPFQAKIKIDSPHVKIPFYGYEWRGHQITLSAFFWDLKSITANFDGDQNLSAALIPFLNTTLFHLEKGRIDLTLNHQNKLTSFDFHCPTLKSNSFPQQDIFQNVHVTFSNLDKPFFYKLKTSLDIMDVKNFLNPSLPSIPLKLSAEIEMSGLQNVNRFPRTYAEWRDAGGIIDIHTLKLDWAPILLTTNGTLTLDASMRLLGSFAAEIYGYEEALNRLVSLKQIKSKHAKRASFILQLFSSTDNAGRPYIKIPITLQNGVLSTGPLNLLKLPHLDNKVIN